MNAQLLRISFRLQGIEPAQYEAIAAESALGIAEVPGLLWKIWPLSADGVAGGIYLFEDAASLRAYVDGPVVAYLKSAPIFADLQIEEYAILEEPSTITRGPVPMAATVAARPSFPRPWPRTFAE